MLRRSAADLEREPGQTGCNCRATPRPGEPGRNRDLRGCRHRASCGHALAGSCARVADQPAARLAKKAIIAAERAVLMIALPWPHSPGAPSNLLPPSGA